MARTRTSAQRAALTAHVREDLRTLTLYSHASLNDGDTF